MDSNHQIICKLVFKRTFLPTLQFQAPMLALEPSVGGSHGVVGRVGPVQWAHLSPSVVETQGVLSLPFKSSLIDLGESDEVRD